MNTFFKHKILAGVMLCSALFMASSCEDSVGLEVTPEVPYADKTLYEVITADPDLTDFVEVINSCGALCADSLFNHSRVYTVWAPKNGTFNKDSIIAEAQSENRDIVFKSFVMTHIANYLRAANGKLDENNKILLLNGKVAVFEGDPENGYTFNGKTIEKGEYNIRTWNGMLHKLATPSEYRYNIWEYLKLASGVDSVANYLYSSNEYVFDESKSIKGPIENGEQTYLDSVFLFKNKWLTVWGGIGNINAEDSSYTVYVPTNEVWEKQVAKLASHYRYNMTSRFPLSMDSTYRDSLRNYYPRLDFLKYLTYSNLEQRYVDSPDSIMPAHRSALRPEFPRTQLEQHVIDSVQLSNGVFKIIDEYPFSMLELCHDTVFLECENTGMLQKYTPGVYRKTMFAYKNQINKDSVFANSSVSGGAYYQLGDATTTSPLQLRYSIPDLLSAKYKIAVIFVPGNITNNDIQPEELTQKLVKMKIFDGEKEIKVVEKLVVDHTRVDTVFMAENGEPIIYNVPVCEYYRTGNKDDYATRFEIESSYIEFDEETFTPALYDPSLLVDKIMFIPVLDEE